MKDFIIAGVDVSKATLDVCLKPSGITMKIDNSISGFKNLFQELKKSGLEVRNALVVMEHTGSYSYRLEKFLRSRAVNYCKVAALQIKRSIGIVRGKNDKIDAARIAEYGWLRREELKPDEPVSESLETLKQLLSMRNKLVKDRSGYKCRQKEMKSSYDYKRSDVINQSTDQIINAFTRQIHSMEKAIQAVIDSDQKLKQISLLIQSIRGVGLIVAVYMICYTNNFSRFTNARKFNCYAGIAPFTHESGTSIKGRTRISHLANKELKTLLNLAAWSAIRHDPELKKYYNRRVTEGIKKMSCVNIIRSKIVSRIFAVAKRETPFVHLPIAA